MNLRKLLFSRSAESQKSQRGIALILAIFTIVLVSYLATELAYETNVEYLVNSAAVNRVKAYYAARAGVELSLLRIKIYSQVVGQLNSQAKGMVKQDLIDMIWKMPFTWPPTLPDEVDQVQKEMISDKVKDSLMEANYSATISDEGSKINVNSLWTITKAMRDATRQQLIMLFKDKMRDDEKWARAHQDLNPEDLIDNMQDWVCPSNQSSRGGDKSSRFSSMGDGYPPNRGFRTVDEIRLVPGMTEDAFAVIRDQVTVFGMQGINPNVASKDVLMSLDFSITSKIADEIIQHRDDTVAGGPFTDANDFWKFVATQGARLDPSVQNAIPIITDSIYNFRISSTGSDKNTSSEITAITYDLTKSSAQSYNLLKTESSPSSNPANAATATPAQPNTPQNPANNNNSASKGPPRIVYWNEQ